MKKIEIYYAILNGSDGSAHINWYLEEEHASKADESQDEGWGEPCTGSVETFEGSDIHREAEENSKEAKGKHEYLKANEFYETRSVGTRAHSDKGCEHCGGIIKKGTPHDMNYFYPEFSAYATHKECTQLFIDSLN